MFHFRRTRKKYVSYPKSAHCDFCDPSEMQARLVEETDHAFVIKNRTFYDVWELARVTDHLLIVPKEHVGTVDKLTDAAKLDIMNLIGNYEKTDYNVYARAVTNTRRSVAHQHTHLIKTDHKAARIFLRLRKPYLSHPVVTNRERKVL